MTDKTLSAKVSFGDLPCQACAKELCYNCGKDKHFNYNMKQNVIIELRLLAELQEKIFELAYGTTLNKGDKVLASEEGIKQLNASESRLIVVCIFKNRK